jgi:hypothetical protein
MWAKIASRALAVAVSLFQHGLTQQEVLDER